MKSVECVFQLKLFQTSAHHLLGAHNPGMCPDGKTASDLLVH